MARKSYGEKDEDRPAPKSKLLKEAQERFKLCLEAESEQRDREREDLRFQVPEFQWDDDAIKARKGDQLSPPRPVLSITKLDQPIRLIVNQMRAADLGVQIHPLSEDADDDTAEMLQGLYRHVERKSRAELARAFAYDRAVKCGRGVYRVLTEYDEEGGDPLDQKIVIQRILHQDGVYFDPAATEPDFSDGKYAFVVSWMSAGEFKRLFPKAAKPPGNRLEWEGLRTSAPEWVRDDDMLVAEYWYKEIETEEIGRGDRKRTRETVTVRCSKLCGWQELESYDWPGRWIPLIPVIGRELQPFDDERRYVGVIGPAKDGQKLYNFSASTLVERMALEPKTPFVGPAEVFEGYEDQWKQANTRNFPYLPYNVVVRDGTVLPPPQRAQIDQAGSSLAMMALQEADQFIQATTAIFDPSLGRLPQKERSGRAIQALQQQADAGSSDYLQNLADISLTYEARVVLDLIPKIFDRPGRITRIIRGDDKKSAPVMLGRPFVVDQQTKRPMPAQPNEPGAKTYDLSRGVYDVAVSVGKSYQTRLQEGNDRIGEMLAAKPELFMLMGDLFLRFQDWPGAKEMADRMAKVREKQFPGLGEGEDGQPPPEQIKAQLEGMGQQMQALQAQLQQAVQALQTEQAKQQAQIMKAQLDAQTTMGKAQLEADTKLRVAAADNETKLALAGMEAKFEALLALLNLEHETKKLEAAQAHEATMGELGRLKEPEMPETKINVEE